MDTSTLRTFIALSQIKNFTKTARQLYIAQSTVTNRIRDLEKELGVLLFTRNRKQIELTSAGEKFLPYAQQLIRIETAALQDVHISPHDTHPIHIGTTNTIYECHLQKRLHVYLQTASHASLHITIGHTPDMLAQLQDHVFDAVFSFNPLLRDGYISLPYRTDTLVLVCAYNRTTYAQGIRKNELQHIDYLFCNFALQGIGLYIRDLFPKHHRFPLEIDNSTKLPHYVAAGFGYTFLPQSLIEDTVACKKLRVIPLLDFAAPKVDSYYITRSPATVPDTLTRILWE